MKTVAQIREAAYDAQLAGNFIVAAELYAQVADSYSAQELQVSALAREDVRRSRETAHHCRSMAA